jgi:putative hemolysin
MLVKPVARHGRRCDEADRLVILAGHLIAEAAAPGPRAQSVRPCVRVALAAQADEDRAGLCAFE